MLMTDRLHIKRCVSIIHLLVLLILFIPPVMLCTTIASNQDVVHFIGVGVMRLSYLAVPGFLLIPLIHGCLKKVPHWLFLMTLWAPAVFFIFLSYYYKDQLRLVSGALENQDCFAFTEKRYLHQSYVKAVEVYNDCSEHNLVSSIRDCPHYYDISIDWALEWDYLQDLEARFYCTGICGSGRRIWEHAGAPAPSCGPFVSQWIRGANIQADLVMGYDIFLLVLAVPLLSIFLDGVLKGYYDPLCNADAKQPASA